MTAENVINRLRANVERSHPSCTDIDTDEAKVLLAELDRLRTLRTALIVASGMRLDTSDDGLILHVRQLRMIAHLKVNPE